MHVSFSLSTVLINCSRHSVDLLVNGISLFSEECTTPGDPIALPFYALATIPLIKELSSVNVHQV